MMNTGSLYAELTQKINRVRRKEHGVAVQGGIINALTATIAVWTLAFTIEAIAELESPDRTILFWGTIALNALLAAWLILPSLARYIGMLRGEDDDALARRIGVGIPAIGDHLVNTLQLYRTSGGAMAVGFSPELVEASIASQGEPLRHYDYTVIVERDERKRSLLFFIIAVAVISTLFLAFPTTYNGAMGRLMAYDQDFMKPAPFSLAIIPGNRKLLRGDSIEIVVSAAGVPPRTVTLRLEGENQAPEDIELRADSLGNFRYTIPAIRQKTIYRAISGPVRTPRYTLEVFDRPEIRMLRATVTWPGYTRRGVERLPDNVGDVSGLRGSSVNITVTTNIEPARAQIVQLFPRGAQIASIAGDAPVPTRFDTVRLPMSVNGTTVTGGFRLSRDGEYYIAITSAEGIANNQPVHYRMSVSTDGPPSIALMQPTDSVEIDQTMLLPVQLRIADDYGFSRLRVMWRLSASRYAAPMKEFRQHPIPIPRNGSNAVEVPYIWDMTGMSMVPEDEVEIYFEVYDNDAVSGPKVARTSVVKVRFPSLEEVLNQAEKAQIQANNDLDKVLQQAQDTRKQMDELNRELMKQLAQNQQQPSWQNQQKLQEAMRQHEQMQQKLQDVAENLKAVTEKLQQAKAISPETLEKYMELQKLFEEMKSPELMEQMKKMQEQMERMSPEELAEAMKNYKFNEEQFRKSIERTMNILKRMQTEQKVDEMIRRAEELERQQENINKQMEKTDPQDKAMREQLAERQKQLAENAEKMEQEMKDLSKEMQEQEGMPQEEMKDAQKSLDEQNPREKMEQAGEQMQQGDMKQARQQGEKAKQSAEQFKQKMQGVKKKMQENGKKDVANKMKKSLKDLLDLSKRQEELKKKTEETQPNSQQFRDLAQQQGQMKEQMEQITEQMMQLAEKTFAVTPEMGKELGDAMKQMGEATESLEQRDGGSAAQKEGEAMKSMNNAAKMMSQALNQMQSGQDGGQGMMGMGMGSMQQRLQQMAAQQQMINQAMSEQMGQGQGGQQGQEGEGKDGKGGSKNGKGGEGNGEGSDKEGKNGKQMGRLSKQQSEVKKSLEELNKEVRESGGTKKNMLGDLERAIKEIEEVMTDMQSGQVTPETVQRQEKILSRLLDAARSQRERDFEKQRESKPGVDVTRQSPGDLRFPNAPDAQTRRDQLNSREQGYTKDYEYMIRKYFEMLGQGSSSTSSE